MKNEKFCVYQHKTPNGKYYIGITSLKPERRWQNGFGYLNQVFGRAVLKYGWDNIEHTVLYKDLNQKEAELIEEDLIFFYKQQKLSYNVDNGSNSSISKRTEESKKKMSDSLKKKWQDPEFKEKMRLVYMKRRGTKNKMTPERIFKQEQRLEKERLLELKKKETIENRKVLQYTLNGEFIKEWNNVKEIAEYYKVTPETVWTHLKGKTKKCVNHLFKYKTDKSELILPVSKESKTRRKPDFIFKYNTNGELIESFNNYTKAGKSVMVKGDTFKKHTEINKEYKGFVWEISK